MRVAVIDVGTYSTRLTIADIKDKDFKILYEEGHITALGRGVKKTGLLSEEGIKDTLKVIEKYKKLCEEYGVQKCLVLGTEALRIAKNRDKFLKELQKLGLDIKIISPQEEGKYAYIGAFYAVKPQGKVCVIDQGGGSTEFIFGQGLDIEEVISLPMGIVNLTEGFIKHNPPTEEEIKNLLLYLDEKIKPVVRPVDTLVGLGGTITTVAALEYSIYPYDPSKINGLTLTKEQIKKWFEKLSRLTVEERKKIPQIEDKRAEAIVPGIAMFWRILENFGKYELIVSDWGVKQGALISNFVLKEN